MLTKTQGGNEKAFQEITPERLLRWFGVPYPFQLTVASVTMTWGICRAYVRMISPAAAASRNIPEILTKVCVFIVIFLSGIDILCEMNLG
jgi:hypothetical protein